MITVSRRAMLMALVGCGVACDRNLAATVFVVRHAETAKGPNKRNPDLSERGLRRARRLVGALNGHHVHTIMSSPYRRTQQTVAQVAKATGVKVQTVAAGNVRGLVAQCRRMRGGAALIAGHSNTVPEIIAALGVFAPVFLSHHDYGDLFVVNPKGAAVTLERRQF